MEDKLKQEFYNLHKILIREKASLKVMLNEIDARLIHINKQINNEI